MRAGPEVVFRAVQACLQAGSKRGGMPKAMPNSCRSAGPCAVRGAPARAVLPFHFGLFPTGPLDGITDVPGVSVANLTKIEGNSTPDRRDGRSAERRPMDDKVSAGFLCL